ncbi:hypothetical protein [uncultured Desulfovibrio sp.]|uniref:hypothetical protein n=1 Tax=uncultured Desulfovibrio sp. TaxID=167968 RepID=UPI002050864B|nr:hypothetical protein [uncultured Desulfovibrio sp.]DAV75458.1 MAG TPA: hypothetical protein [Caudoviricetes sp.]
MGNTTIHTVAGQNFETYSDFARRCTFARNAETGEVRQISWSGYVRKDLTVRKAIASAFNLSTFRK